MSLCARIFAVAAVVLFLAAPRAVAQVAAGDGTDSPDLSAEVLVGTRPDREGVPTKVLVGIYVIDIVSINDVEGTFTADVHWTSRWADPRLSAGSED
jgi:hypothetical protein